MDIYGAYRMTLKSRLEKRAGARKQAARSIIAKRYKIGHAEIKRIVNEQDVLNGVTHEHTNAYLDELALEAAQSEFERNPVPCGCGNTEMVRVRVDPFMYEIHGVIQMRVMCFLCYLFLEQEI